MNINTLNEADALSFCERQEDHFFDRKAFEVRPAKLQRLAVAFANSDGGEFVVGITDSNQEPDPYKRWQGKGDIEDFNQHIQVLTEATPTLPFRFSFLTCVHMPGYVLHVEVDKSGQVHQTTDRTVYIKNVSPDVTRH
jgi:ATP-dependent DNA helicase RecG